MEILVFITIAWVVKNISPLPTYHINIIVIFVMFSSPSSKIYQLVKIIIASLKIINIYLQKCRTIKVYYIFFNIIVDFFLILALAFLFYRFYLNNLMHKFLSIFIKEYIFFGFVSVLIVLLYNNYFIIDVMDVRYLLL